MATNEHKAWGREFYGCVYTSLSNNVTFWKGIAKNESMPDTTRKIAVQQSARYAEALDEFERLFN